MRGGHETHILHYATELRKHGFETRVVVADPLPAREHLLIRLLRERGIALDSISDFVKVRVSAAFSVLLVPWAIRQALRGIKIQPAKLRLFMQNQMVARALAERIRSDAPDIIHVWGRLADNLWAVLPAERTVFHHATAGNIDSSWEPTELEHFRRFVSSAARNFAPGEGVAANVRRSLEISNRIEPVYTICPDETGGACPAPESRSAGQSVRFGIICRMIKEKGIEHLLEALKIYRSGHGDASFCFAGKGYLDPMISEYVQANSLVGVTRIPEFASPVEVLKNIDVFVHPSISDAMPMAVAEALMCGRPCIVSCVGGLPDLVRDGIEGLVIEPGSPAAIVAAMTRFVEMDAEELRTFQDRARARYEEVCRPECIGAIVAGHYRAILSRLVELRDQLGAGDR